MATRAVRTVEVPSTPHRRDGRPRPEAVGEEAVAHPSPALALQASLERAVLEGYPEPSVEKFPGAMRVAILVALCGLSWAPVIAAARFVLRSPAG